MVSLTWRQVNTWRLSQQYLAPRQTSEDLIEVVRRTLGIHAQVMSAAEMAIGVRVEGITPQDVQSALWRERSLVKTWMMRQTLHLVPAADFPTYIAARRITDINWPLIFNKSGIDRATLDAYLAVAPDILARGPLTRRQFVEDVSARLKSSEFRDFLVKGNWGTAFKPLALHGELCFGPNNGQDTTFIRPSAWIGDRQAPDPEAALQDIVRRYLMVYGPTHPRNFQVWWWMSGSSAKHAFDAIADETEEVDVEGWRATAMKSAVQSMLELEPSGEVNLLPAFDIYTVGLAHGKDLEKLFALEHQKKVYRPQGWVSAVVLVDGFIKGTWNHKVQNSKTTISVNLFSSPANTIQEKLADEADRLGKFLNSEVQLEFTQS